MVEPPVPGQGHVEERLAEAGDDPGRPGPVAPEVHPDEDHAGRDLRPVRPPALLPVGGADVVHHGPGGQLVVALDVGADVGTELACPLVLNINIILVRYFKTTMFITTTSTYSSQT